MLIDSLVSSSKSFLSSIQNNASLLVSTVQFIAINVIKKMTEIRVPSDREIEATPLNTKILEESPEVQEKWAENRYQEKLHKYKQSYSISRNLVKTDQQQLAKLHDTIKTLKEDLLMAPIQYIQSKSDVEALRNIYKKEMDSVEFPRVNGLGFPYFNTEKSYYFDPVRDTYRKKMEEFPRDTDMVADLEYHMACLKEHSEVHMKYMSNLERCTIECRQFLRCPFSGNLLTDSLLISKGDQIDIVSARFLSKTINNGRVYDTGDGVDDPVARRIISEYIVLCPDYTTIHLAKAIENIPEDQLDLHDPSIKEGIEQILSDPASLELFDDPVVLTDCGHTLSRATFRQLQQAKCPCCRTDISNGSVWNHNKLNSTLEFYNDRVSVKKFTAAWRIAREERDRLLVRMEEEFPELQKWFNEHELKYEFEPYKTLSKKLLLVFESHQHWKERLSQAPLYNAYIKRVDLNISLLENKQREAHRNHVLQMLENGKEEFMEAVSILTCQSTSVDRFAPEVIGSFNNSIAKTSLQSVSWTRIG